MPIPLVAAGLYSALVGIFAAIGFRDQVNNVIVYIQDYLESESGAAYVTGVVNNWISKHGLDFQFSNIASADAVKNDIDGYAAQRVNGKAGTQFTTLKNITRDEFLAEVGRVLAARVNAECGSNLATIWPVEKFRAELGTDLARQFTSADLAPGGLFPQSKVTEIRASLVKGLAGYKPLASPSADVKAAQNRARQAKYARHHKRVWV